MGNKVLLRPKLDVKVIVHSKGILISWIRLMLARPFLSLGCWIAGITNKE